MILAAPKKHGDGFAPALILATRSVASLIEHTETDVGAPNVLTLASGSLEKPMKDLVHRQRKQVVVAVCSDGSVVLFDSNLRLKWKSSIPLVSQESDLRDVSALVTPYAATAEVGGMVVVSVREFRFSETYENEYEDDDDTMVETSEERHDHGRSQDESLEELDLDPRTKARHVSYFAFSGNSGDLLWKHSQEDFHKDPMGLLESGMKTLYSDRMVVELQDGLHYGERSCREYRESILASLPHVWFRDEDSSIHVAHFHKHRKHHGSQRQHLASRSDKNSDTINTPPGTHYQWNRDTPLKKTPKPQAPNVIVSHVEDGMEVIHLFTGRPVCRLKLEKKVLHVDVNGDGVPDHVHVSGGIPRPERVEMDVARRQVGHGKIGPCMTRVTAGIPPSIPLFNGTICSTAVQSEPHGLLDIASPVALAVPRQNGHYSTKSLHQKMNLFYFNSRGEVTSFDHRGEKLYTLQTGIEWRQRYPNIDSESSDGDQDSDEQSEDSEYEEQTVSVPTFQAFSFHSHAIPSGILASGSHLATVFSEHGKEIWTGELPHVPIQKMVQTDFNMDGYMDIILVTRQGLYGWTQVRSPGGISVSALAGGLIVVLLVVLVSQNQFVQDGYGPPRRKGRSTDRVD